MRTGKQSMRIKKGIKRMPAGIRHQNASDIIYFYGLAPGCYPISKVWSTNEQEDMGVKSLNIHSHTQAHADRTDTTFVLLFCFCFLIYKF